MRAKALVVVAAAMLLFGAGPAGGGTEADNWTYYGLGAGESNTGYYNTFIGRNSGYSNTSAYYSTFLGAHAGYSNTAGDNNTFVGAYAGYGNITGSENTFLGTAAGYYNTIGSENTFLGTRAGSQNTYGCENTFLGTLAGHNNTTGDYNTFLGARAAFNNTAGYWNVFLGREAGFYNTTGFANTFLGPAAGWFNTTGNENTFVGLGAGAENTSGSRNVFLGYYAGRAETGSNKLYIDTCYDGDPCTTPLIYGEFDNKILQLRGSFGVHARPLYDFDVSADGESRSSMHFSLDGSDVGGWITSVAENNFFVSSGAVWDSVAGGWVQKSSDEKAVIAGSGAAGYRVLTRSGCSVGTVCPPTAQMTIDYSGKLQMGSGAYCSTGGVWTNASSREYKDNIRSLTPEEARDTLAGLDPVEFTYKADPDETHLGFIAEDAPAILATKDRKGMSPMDVVAVLTKVVQEQQQLVREKSKIIDQQQACISDLAEQVKLLRAEMNGLKAMSGGHRIAMER